MKAKPIQIEALKDKITTQFKGALIFGPDFSVVSDCAMQIIKLILPKTDDFALVKISKGQMKENPSILLDEGNTISIWSDRRVVWLKEADNNHTDMVESYVQNIKTDTFLLLTADNLVKNASLRVFCENEKDFLAIACYEDSASDSRMIIRTVLKSNNFSFSEEVIDSLSARLNENRLTTKNELEKLITFLGDKKEITTADVEKCIPDIKTSTMDALCFFVASGEQSAADKSTDILLADGETAVGIVRALIQHFNKLLIGCDMREKKMESDLITKKLLRANQYMMKEKLLSQIRIWNKEMLLKTLVLLNETEEQTKSTGIIPETVLQRTITMIAGLARKLKRNTF